MIVLLQRLYSTVANLLHVESATVEMFDIFLWDLKDSFLPSFLPSFRLANGPVCGGDELDAVLLLPVLLRCLFFCSGIKWKCCVNWFQTVCSISFLTQLPGFFFFGN